MNSEYSNVPSSNPPCSYGSLGNYDSPYSMNVPPMGKTTSGQYVVPMWNPISYESLTSKIPSCSGYNNIEAAYGADAGSCQTTYRTSLCSNK